MYACRILFRGEFFKFFVLSRSRPCLLISQWKSDNKKIAVCCYPGSEPSFLPSKVRTWKPKIKEVAFGEILIHPLYSEMFKSYDFPQDWNKLPGQGNELNIEMVSGEWIAASKNLWINLFFWQHSSCKEKLKDKRSFAIVNNTLFFVRTGNFWTRGRSFVLFCFCWPF